VFNLSQILIHVLVYDQLATLFYYRFYIVHIIRCAVKRTLDPWKLNDHVLRSKRKKIQTGLKLEHQTNNVCQDIDNVNVAEIQAKTTIKEARQHCKALLKVTVVKLLEVESEGHCAVIAN